MIPLPIEILMQIASHLNPSDKKAVLSTCHDWHEIFRNSLYTTVIIKSFDQFKKLHEALQTSYHKSLIPNGHIIKHLSVQPRKPTCFQKKWPEPELPYSLLESLPQLCPYLESLDFDPTSWKMCVSYCTLDSWKHMRKIPAITCLNEAFLSLQYLGSTLASITVQSRILVDVSTSNRLSSIFSMTPCLEELTIQGEQSEGPILKLKFQDMELLHHLLPKLTRLSIIGSSIEMPICSSKLMAQQIMARSNASELRYLDWETRHIPSTWLLYIARKYPHLRHLQLDVHYNSQEISNGTPQVEELFLNLVDKCRHIETLALSCPTLSHWLTIPFLKSLKNNQCVSQICFPIQKSNQIKHGAELEFIAEHISQFTTMLEVDQWRFNSNISHTFRLLENFHKLSYLKIKCDSYHTEYDLQHLLDSCPALETLVLEWGTLYVPSPLSYYGCTKRYNLRELYVTFIAFETHFSNFLSRTCQSLKVLSMTKCKQLCDIKDMASQTTVYIDMPNHEFETIVLDGIRLDYSSANMFYSGLSSYIRLAYVQTRDDAIWQQHKTTQDADNDGSLIEKLTPRDALAIQAYFDERKQHSFVNTSKDLLKGLYEQKIDNTLKTNLMFGYVDIRCKSLQNFLFSGNINCYRAR
ncbi:hypothetical protein EDC96DRAFT_571169 [Choanephora cucurbitarum]|nr:hypothetical protein EDC96DRAFT_571169 [Choanephora cucurbitarum]